MPPQAVQRRLSFTSSRTRAIWETRLNAIAAAALATELHLVATAKLRAALIWCAYDGLPQFIARLKASNLKWKPAEAVLLAIDSAGGGSAEVDPLTQMTYSFTVARSAEDAEVLVVGGDPFETASAFGYPPCCAAAWVRTLAAGGSDPLARLVADPLWWGHRASTAVMLGTLGLGPVRHLPCGPDCEASREAMAGFIQEMESLGFDEEASWLAAMSDWRAKASIVGSVAEVETGAFRFIWQSDDLSTSLPPITCGKGEPEGAPPGLSSVFAKPSTVERRREALATEGGFSRDEDFAAAGFATPFAHRSRLSCVVWEQMKLLRKSRTALHPGCGGGLLLELLVQTRPSLRVCGLESDPALVARARSRISADTSIVVEANWMAEARLWPMGRARFDLLFVDPEPLIDLDDGVRREIVAACVSQARSIILIATDRALRRFGNLDSMAASLGLCLAPSRAHRVSAALAIAEPRFATA